MLILAMVALSITPKTVPGVVLMAGGGSTTTAMVQLIQKYSPRKSGLILILAQTREDPSQSGQKSVELLQENGELEVKLYDQMTISESTRNELRIDLEKARIVWIPGGNQNYFMERWGEDFLQFEFKKALGQGVSFFGTSAGTAMMSNPMIAGNLENGKAEMKAGIGLVPYLMDTHYRERNRQSRMKSAFTRQSGYALAIGVDRDEAVLYQPGSGIIEMIGSPEILAPK